MNIEQNYQDTLNYLYSFVDYSLTRGFRNLPGQFDLGRMADFLAELGNPQRAYLVIHVAGTKGKGSVCALLAQALQAGGYQVGLYTSPHLEDYAERIRFNGQSIAHAELIALVDEFRPFLDRGTKLTTFEITTALAFLYFARRGATAVVAEVGLGGRLDATNVVEPITTVITSISYDHMQILGNTLAEIAGEKAGIIKPGVPVVVAPQLEEARQAIERIAAERGAPLIEVDRAYRYEIGSRSLDGQTFQVWPNAAQVGSVVELSLRLLGDHQVENAVTAFAALQSAGERGLAVSTAAVQSGYAETVWPGRFEILRRNPPVVVDSAHNRDSAAKLSRTLEQYFPNRRILLIFGASEDKDIAGIFDELLPVSHQVIFTRSFHPRAADLQQLVDEAARRGRTAMIVPAVEDALTEALRMQTEDDLVLATGSIFIAAAARQTWYEGLKTE